MTMIVNAARVSYGKSKQIFDEKDERLIKYLLDNKHLAPFRHPQLQFRITCPIYVERQLFKHQIGLSANSISGRYVDFSDSYTEIKKFRKQSSLSKQGSAEDLSEEINEKCLAAQEEIIKNAKITYQFLINNGVSKEQARTILPLSLNTTFIWTGSLLAFKHLFDLRLKPDTQLETREVVKQMLIAVKNIEGNPFEHTLKAMGYE